MSKHIVDGQEMVAIKLNGPFLYIWLVHELEVYLNLSYYPQEYILINFYALLNSEFIII